MNSSGWSVGCMQGDFDCENNGVEGWISDDKCFLHNGKAWRVDPSTHRANWASGTCLVTTALMEVEPGRWLGLAGPHSELQI